MKRKYTSPHVFRVFIGLTGTDAKYFYDTTQPTADRALEHVMERLTNAGIYGVKIIRYKDLGYRRKYVDGTLEHLIRTFIPV